MALAISVWACATAIAGIGAWLSVVFGRQSLRDDRTQADRDFQAEPVGLGISELRIHYGPGYCVYFQKRGSTIIVLPCGGDKSTQAKDIKAAKRLADEWSE
ncbi:MAG: type II toxin-antitoxin system RelE/ParE family toxin [Acidithiobacillus ferriphilus]